MTLWRVALLLVLFLACLSLGASAASVNGTSVVVWVDGSSTLAVASCEEAPLPCGTEEQPCGSIAGVVDALQPCLCQFNSTDPCIASVEFMLTGNVHLNTSLQLPAAHWAFTGKDAAPTLVGQPIDLLLDVPGTGSLELTNLAFSMTKTGLTWGCPVVATDCSFFATELGPFASLIKLEQGQLEAWRCSFTAENTLIDVTIGNVVSLVDCAFSGAYHNEALNIANATVVVVDSPTFSNCSGVYMDVTAVEFSLSNCHLDLLPMGLDTPTPVVVEAVESIVATNCSATGRGGINIFYFISSATVVEGMRFDTIVNAGAGLNLQGSGTDESSWASVVDISSIDNTWEDGELIFASVPMLYVDGLRIENSAFKATMKAFSVVTVLTNFLLDQYTCGGFLLETKILSASHWRLPSTCLLAVTTVKPHGVLLLFDDLTTTVGHCRTNYAEGSASGKLIVTNSDVSLQFFSSIFQDPNLLGDGFSSMFTNSRIVSPALSIVKHSLGFTNCTITASEVGWSFRLRLSTAVFIDSTFDGSHEGRSRASAAKFSPFALETSNVTVSNCNFINLTGKRGGVFYVASESILEVDNSTFSVASADDGGALWCTDSTLNFTSVFVRGGSSPAGGGFVLHSCVAHFRNLAVTDSHATAGAGGAMQVTGNSEVVVMNGTFVDCTALRGGALSFIDESTALLDTVEIRDCSATAGGGALFFGDKSKAVIHEAKLLHNSGASFGGAVYVTSYSELVFDRCTFVGCSTSALGGALFAQDFAHVDIVESYLAYNSAASSAGAVAYVGGSFGAVVSSLFEHNSANSKGGAIDVAQYAAPTFRGVTFLNNTGSVGGAMSLNNYANVTMEECLFSHNSASSHGGGVSMGDNSMLHIEYTSFSNNTAVSGGALFSNREAEVLVYQTNFTSNSAGFGGAFFVSSFQGAAISNAVFYLNTATRGGALSFAPAIQPTVAAFIEDSLLLSNSAHEGGAFSLNDKAFVVMNSTLVFHNKATRKGGGAQVAGLSTLYANDCVVANNEAVLEGGGFSLTEHSSIRLYRVDMRSNRARFYGGAVCAQLGPEVVVNHAAFYDNEALKGGACFIHVSNSTTLSYVHFRDTLFRNNTANASGGGVALQHRSASNIQQLNPRKGLVFAESMEAAPAFFDCDFINNRAVNGGAVETSQTWASSQTLLVSILMHGNTATQLGGAVFVPRPGVASVLFYNASLVNNVAGWGGANVGWVELTNSLQLELCAGNCTVTEGTQQYGTALGTATAPSTGVFLSECPSSLFLDDSPFTVTVGVTDDFGSLVKGNAVLSSNITVVATLAEDSACSLGSQQGTVLDALDGQATLELQLRGKQETECVISFEYTTNMARPITSGQCLVLVANCTNPDMDVVQQKEFDTCGFVDKSITPGTIALIILVVLLFLTVCLVYGILFIGWNRRRQRKARTTVANLEFEDVLKLGWSIESLLCDTSIRNIPFDCLLIHERIGVGASGIVSSAELFPEFPDKGEGGPSAVPPLPRQVAVKELRLPTNLIGEAAMQAFVHEIQLLNALEHENIVQFIGISYDGSRDALCLVTELMDQGSLSDVIRKKGHHLSRSLKLKLAAEAAAGMNYLHGCNVLHRDLKTQNLLVNSAWQCKISDFGISTMKNQTMTTTCIGTPLYMAPEVLQHSRYSEQADVYSFGIVLVELFTAKAAYAALNEAGVNDGQIIYRVVVDGYRPDLDALPHSLQELVGECLSNKPALRPSFEEVHRRLTRLQSKALQVLTY